MKISLIVATDLNGVIGDEKGIPWRLPNDLKRFKKLTLGKPVLMGRTTHEHVGRVLPGRVNIVLSRRRGYRAEGCLVVPDLSTGLKEALATGTDEAMIIGGGQVYREALPFAERVYLTRVDGIFPGTVAFELEDANAWLLVHKEHVEADAKNPYASTFLIYDRIH